MMLGRRDDLLLQNKVLRAIHRRGLSLRDAFTLLDRDGSGELDATEFVQGIIREFDGCISWNRTVRAPQTESEWTACPRHCVAPLRCATALHHCVALLRCTTALHHSVAPLRFTTAPSKPLPPSTTTNHCRKALLRTTATDHCYKPPPASTPPLRHCSAPLPYGPKPPLDLPMISP